MRAVILVLVLAVPSVAWGLCVNEEKANLRKGPSMKHPKTWEVIRYTPLKRLGKQGGWYHVEDLDGQKHWVREDLVTSSFACAAVKTEFANLRKGPGTNWPSAQVPRGEKYLSFRILQTKGRWLRLEDVEGDIVWAARENFWVQ